MHGRQMILYAQVMRHTFARERTSLGADMDDMDESGDTSYACNFNVTDEFDPWPRRCDCRVAKAGLAVSTAP